MQRNFRKLVKITKKKIYDRQKKNKINNEYFMGNQQNKIIYIQITKKKEKQIKSTKYKYIY